MPKDNQIAVRVNDPTHDAIKEYAEEYDLTQAGAVREMTERVLRGEGYLDTPGAAIPDGGEIAEQFDAQAEQITHLQRTQQTATAGTLVGLLWVGVVLALDLPSWAVIATGSLLVGVIGTAIHLRGDT